MGTPHQPKLRVSPDWEMGCPLMRQSTLVLELLIVFFPAAGYGDTKQWSGLGDGSSWEDPANWSPSLTAPAASDDALIDKENTAVTMEKTFSVKSLALGGKESEISLTKQEFVYGAITPENSADAALELRQNGIFTLQNVGDVTLKGALKFSNQTAIQEPSFMFVAE